MTLLMPGAKNMAASNPDSLKLIQDPTARPSGFRDPTNPGQNLVESET